MRVTLRLTRGEVRRLLGRLRLWVLVVLVSGWGAIVTTNAARAPYDFVQLSDSVKIYPHLYATGLIHSQLSLLSILAMALPFVVCDTLPLDRKTRYVGLMLTRGVGRSRVIASRILAVLTVAAIMVLTVLAVVAMTALLAAEKAHGQIGATSAFLSSMLDSNPALYFCLVALVYVLICTGVLSVGVLVGALSTSWLNAVLLPPIILLVSMLAPLPQSLVPFSPGARATFVDYQTSWATPTQTAVYWCVVVVAVSVVGALVYGRREDL